MTSSPKPSGRARHSFIQFYMADWLAGTARMPRLARSIYFDVCCHNWDKNEPVSRAELMLMVSDLDPEQANFLVQNLVDTGKLIENPDGSVYSERAIAEAQRAYAAWEAKSRGGRGKGKQEQSSGTPAGKQPQNQNQNQNQNQIEEEADASSPALLDGQPDDGQPEQKPAKVDFTAKRGVVAAWNAMAVAAGLSQVAKITEERSKRLGARIADHGTKALTEAIATVPDSPFLMGGGDKGWKANFDWLLQPESCAKLIEGNYHNEGKGRGNGWTTG